MNAINFEILKVNKIIQFEIPLNSTFLQVSNLIFKNFNLDINDFPISKYSSLKFIYDSILCINCKTIESYGIQSQSTIKVFVPKKILPFFLQGSMKQPQEISSKPISQTPNTTIPIANNYHPNNNKPPTATDNSSSCTYSIPDISSIITSKELSSTNSDNDGNHSIILRLANKRLLSQLMEAGYDKLDSAYAIVYRADFNCAIDLIQYGISSDPEFRFHVGEIASGRARDDDAVRHEIEMAKIEARKKGENENIAAAAVMTESNILNRFLDQKFINEVRLFYINVRLNHEREIAEKVEEDMKTKQIIVNYDGNPQLVSLRKISEVAVNMNKHPTMMYSQANTAAQLELNRMNDINKRFSEIFVKFPSMTPENYVNPYRSLYNEYTAIVRDQNYLRMIEYGKNMNYDQLAFLYRMHVEKRASLNEVIQLLISFDGNMEEVENIINYN